MVGEADGDTVGVAVVGDLVGELVGRELVGDAVGDAVGEVVGLELVGDEVGDDVGAVGAVVGVNVGQPAHRNGHVALKIPSGRLHSTSSSTAVRSLS